MDQTSASCSKRIRPVFGKRRGAMAMLLLGALVVLLGFSALALNLAWLTSHKVQLHRACQAAVLAGAVELLDPTVPPTPDVTAEARVAAAIAQARAFFAPNSSAILQTSGDSPDVVAGWCQDPTMPDAPVTQWTGTGPVNAISVRGVRRRSNGQAVVMWFGNIFGTSSAEPAAVAIASMDQRIYGFRPLDYVPVPMVPLMAPSTIQWPSGAVAAATGLSDDFSVDPRTGAVSSGPDQIAEVTLLAPAAATWLALSDVATNFNTLVLQVSEGIVPMDLGNIGGQLALGTDGTLPVPAAAEPNLTQAEMLLAALSAIQGQKRIWPIGELETSGGQLFCRINGFVAGQVVDCSRSGTALTIVVQACTIQTCTGLLRSPMAINPWIGKLILNE